MALVVAILFAAVTGAFSASLPLPDIGLPELETSLDTALDALGSEKVRRSVLDDVKQLLDTQISALVEDGVKRISGMLKMRLKPKRSRRPLMKEDKKPESVSQEIGNSDLIKALTDSSLQDPADMVLRKTVDELLEEDGDKTLAQDESNIGGIIQENDDDHIKVEKSANSHEEETENVSNHDTPQKVRKHKHNGNKKNRDKNVNRVIIEHTPKKHADIDALDSIVDLDEILKSTLKDLSDSSSHEDDVTDHDDESVDDYISHEIKIKHEGDGKQNEKISRRKRIDENSKDHEDQIENHSENKNIESSEDGQLERVNHINVDENLLLTRGSRRNNDDILENHNSTQTSRKHETDLIEEEHDHSLKHHADEKPSHDHNEKENHHSKTHHNKHHHIHNTNEKSHHEKSDHYGNSPNAKNASIIEIRDDTEDTIQDHAKISHTVTTESKTHLHENRETTDKDDNHALLITKESDSEEKEKVTQDKSARKKHITEAKHKSNKATYVDEHEIELTDTHENASKEYRTIDKDENVTEVKTNVTDEKPTEEKGDKKEDKSKERDNISEDDTSLTDEIQHAKEDDLANEDSAVSDETGRTEEEISDSEEKKNIIKENKRKKDQKHVCSLTKHHASKENSLQSAESEVINELIHNKDMKKSYTFTLSFTTK